MRRILILCLAAITTAVAFPAAADQKSYCGIFVQHPRFPTCTALHIPGKGAIYHVIGLDGKRVTPARGTNCPPDNWPVGNVPFQVTTASPRQLADGWCAFKGFRDYNPSIDKARPPSK